VNVAVAGSSQPGRPQKITSILRLIETRSVVTVPKGSPELADTALWEPRRRPCGGE
jgi:hypothetical protein